MTTNNKPNRLAKEKSPYLLQHAYNPVDWYPWGEEAFEKAKIENKPVFVSIGYSTCHWCHVMERESFEDEEVAKLLNERFVSIKVDREERPDIDSIYMNICQLMTGHGGWPLNVFITPDQKPFYAGTYFPPESKYGVPGFKEVITQLYDQYQNNRDKIDTIAAEATEALRLSAERSGAELLSADVLHKTYQELSNRFNSIYGGFGDAPKFPMPHTLIFLLKYYKWTDAEIALKMVERTLNAMADGGIYDHVGFGFARYSVDEQWLVPHFEKMLYDNALLLYAYAETYQVTNDSRYKEIVEQIVTFVDREMTDQQGAFYSAIDADSEGVEGKYYVWSKQEIIDLLGEKNGEFYSRIYDITSNGNFEGENIPNLLQSNMAKTFSEAGLSTEDGKQKLEELRKVLLEKRTQRVYPHLDDKILTAWNALMIAGLAKAGQALQNEAYFEKAEKALQFIEKQLVVDGELLARYRDGEAKYLAYLDDWAFLLWSYLEMYEGTANMEYLSKAVETARKLRSFFWDEQDGGFFFTRADSESLIVREKQAYDGAIPSGNSVAAVNLLRLGHFTGDTEWLDMADEILKVFKPDIQAYGSGHTFLLQSLLLKEFPMKEVVIVGEARQRLELFEELRSKYTPELAVVTSASDEGLHTIYERGYRPLADRSLTVYICENFACKQPLTSKHEVLSELKINENES
ncbi:hypothetical protein CVD25_19430 [Bacillus canaveralius]|uniref:Spermatogenesis-associated protein 20-like TRX domain-containing protein n=1 Tax=Bacillus canaveralius TaxID=1403243 RepID=A0A2N5GIN2_9BACI|nr:MULTISPECIES: thioredoxin domain-containing protein [Bacillus]PLR80876.1 hypothetical protein CU635_16540 [Bacillus canaveralius]PLR83398.1 hypothetical protein CVD23_14475 [Bacillus sp. V33-4]PLR91164.1 hypothetical protein CVD25_19430 [Bacillus canaveralius]RSK51758.1 thioredoxin domain-containing protein [Bacillus canaveralius]